MAKFTIGGSVETMVLAVIKELDLVVNMGKLGGNHSVEVNKTLVVRPQTSNIDTRGASGCT